METLEKCNLCGGQDRKVVERYSRYNQDFTLVECEDCGLVFLNPRPTFDEMSQYYGESYAAHRVEQWESPGIFRSLLGGGMKAWLKLRLGKSRGLSMLAQSIFPVEFWWRWKVRCECLHDLASVGRVLDVGCGNGGWLRKMSLCGFECYGCEIDRYWATIAESIRGIQIKVGDLHAAHYPDNFFDLVHVWHVLEHVHDPLAFLLEARRVLKPNGLLVVSCPNRDSILSRVYTHLEDVPRHIFSFSTKTIAKYFLKAGIHLTHLRTIADPYDIYSPLYEASLAYLCETGASEMEMKEVRKFWSSRMRRIEYRPTRQFINKIGAGSCFLASGVKTEL
jgi:2-polyprenyl-3-methyl-5-hydroxy-6-metoxy-1,4-benzoquinol methylase